MNDKDTKVPEIRFQGFTDAWEQRKLKDVADVYDGTHQTPDYTQSGVKFISVENIKDINRSKKFISKKDYIEQFKIKPQINDIFMTRITAGVIGETALLTENNDLAYYVSLALIRSQRINPLFLEKYIGSSQFKNELNKRIIHTAFPKKINLGDIGECKVSFPICDSEQKKLGIFLITLDNTITLHKRKLDELKELKRGYLQQMFPQTGENVPRVRFAGFIGDWEMRKLGNMVEKLKSYSLSRDVETKEETGYRYIHYGDIHKQVADLIITDEQLPRIKISDYIPLNRGDLVLADASEDYKGIAEPSIILHEPQEKIIAGLHTIALRPQNTNALFLYYLFHTDMFKRYGCQAGTGLKVFGITFDNLSIFETTIPIHEEQIAIGDFLYNFDCIIEKQQIKLNKLKQLKSAYLQKMFI